MLSRMYVAHLIDDDVTVLGHCEPVSSNLLPFVHAEVDEPPE